MFKIAIKLDKLLAVNMPPRTRKDKGKEKAKNEPRTISKNKKVLNGRKRTWDDHIVFVIKYLKIAIKMGL